MDGELQAAEAADWAPRVCPDPAAAKGIVCLLQKALELRQQGGLVCITSLQTSEVAKVAAICL